MKGAHNRERGANLVEFAILAPLLLLLLLGIVEFGWKFGQFNDVRHAAREGARYAAVNGGDNNAIRDHVCNAMDALSAGVTEARIELTGGGPSGEVGDTARIRVEADVASLTSAPLISFFMPDQLASEVEFRLEQNSTSWGSSNTQCL